MWTFLEVFISGNFFLYFQHVRQSYFILSFAG